MSVTAATGTAQLKTTGLIPEVYADEFNVEYHDNSLLPKLTRGKYYEGVLEQGDKVIVPTLPRAEFTPYLKNQELPVTIPEGSSIEMTVDRAEFFNVLVDRIDSKQSHIDIVEKYKENMLETRQSKDTEQMFADIYNQAAAENQGATAGVKSGGYNLGVATAPVAITASTVEAVLTLTRAVLEEQNAGIGDLWLVVPVWVRYLIINSDLMKVNEMGIATKSGRLTGLMGSIDGMEIYSSNLLKTTTADQPTGTYIMAGNRDAISYIQQLNEVRIIKEDGRFFGQLLQGLWVYDWKVRKPEGLVSLYAYKG